MLKFLVTPEMEVERIFNMLGIRIFYQFIFQGIKNPQELISANYNHAFQSLAGIYVFQ
jgi:hypothetical protein